MKEKTPPVLTGGVFPSNDQSDRWINAYQK